MRSGVDNFVHINLTQPEGSCPFVTSRGRTQTDKQREVSEGSRTNHEPPQGMDILLPKILNS